MSIFYKVPNHLRKALNLGKNYAIFTYSANLSPEHLSTIDCWRFKATPADQ
jgi:hypothetical protein